MIATEIISHVNSIKREIVHNRTWHTMQDISHKAMPVGLAYKIRSTFTYKVWIEFQFF